MEALTFVADLPESMFDELEHVLFFNAHQTDVRTGIVDAIERYGPPEIVRGEGRIRVTMPACPHSQCLFATVDTPEACGLLGLALYVRDALDAITVLHVAVSDDIVADDGADPLVAVRLVQKIREVGQCLRGVKWVRLLYPGQGQQRLPVARGKPRLSASL